MTRYDSGARFENEVKQFLEGDGWVVIRSAGSLGDFDLAALKGDSSMLIQCKCGAFGKGEMVSLSKRCVEKYGGKCNADLILAHKPKYMRGFYFLNLRTGGKKRWGR